MPPLLGRLVAPLLLLCSASIACGDRAPTGAVAQIGLVLSRPAVDVTAGASVEITISLQQFAARTGTVALSALDVPAGVDVRFTRPVLGGQDTLTALVFSAGADAAPGTSVVRVRAEGSAGTSTVDVTLSVRSPRLRFSDDTRMTVAQGTSASVPIGIVRAPQFTGEVTLALTGVPPDVTARLTPSVLAGDASGSTLTVTPGLFTATGTYTMQLRASAGDGAAVTSTLAITVVPSTVPGATLGVGPSAMQVNVDSTVQGTVTVERSGGFTGPVTLTAADAARGVVVTFGEQPLVGRTTTMRVHATADAALGPRWFEVRASGAGIPDMLGRVYLTVLPPPRFSLRAPAAVEVLAGGSRDLFVDIFRLGGYEHPVEISAGGLPAGVSLRVAPGNATSGIFALHADTLVAAGRYPLWIRGHGAGDVADSVPVQLTVTRPAGSIGLVITPSPLVAIRGGTVSVLVDPTSTGRVNPVSFTVASAPPGISVEHRSWTLGIGYGMIVSVSTDVALGEHVVMFRVTSAGIPEVLVPLPVQVRGP